MVGTLLIPISEQIMLSFRLTSLLNRNDDAISRIAIEQLFER